MFAEALGNLENFRIVAALRESLLAYPLVNALHIVGIALLFGAIVPLDLRLAGWRASAGSVESLSRLLLPVAMFGFVLAACAGLLLFATDARAYSASPLFQAKIVLIVLALVNALWLRSIDWRHTATSRARVAGMASVLLWLGVILLGRLVGYF
jgi:hypothetical protein